MVIIWSDSSINDLKEFKECSQKSDPNKYIFSLVDYVNNLPNHPRLGKIYSYINETIIRQLIYREHKIYYYIEEDSIHILSIVHHRQDMRTRINYIKRYLIQ